MWRRIDKSPINWVQGFEDMLAPISLPDFIGDSIYIASDYSGDHSKSKYTVVSFLYMDINSSPLWESTRRKLRAEYLPDGRRISFKGLGDKVKRRALMPFLEATYKITGIILSIAIDKDVRDIWCDQELFNKLATTFIGNWKGRIYEKAFCVGHFVSLLIGGLSHPGQHIYWVSDEDDIFDDPAKTEDVKRIVIGFAKAYGAYNLGSFSLATTKVDTGDCLEEDLGAIPDLAAGALCEIVNKYSQDHGGRLPREYPISLTECFSEKTNIIARWLFNDPKSLQHIFILADKDDNGVCRMGQISLQ